MKLSIRATAITCALIWAGALFFVGLINRYVSQEYGWWYLKLVDSIYPGYIAAFGVKNLLVGVGYALVDGLVVGTLFAWIYNKVLSCGCCCCKTEEKKES